MRLTKKIILVTFFLILLVFMQSGKAQATCFPKSGACPPGFTACAFGGGSDFCCESASECSNPSFNLEQIENEIGLGGADALIKDYSNIGAILSGLLPYILTGAGIVLLIMLVAGGFTMLSGASSPESQEKGKKQITFAIVGFIVIFAAFWIAQVLQIILKVDIIGVK